MTIVSYVLMFLALFFATVYGWALKEDEDENRFARMIVLLISSGLGFLAIWAKQ